MNNFIFHSPTKVYFGRGYEKQIGSLLKEHGFKKPLLVYGGDCIGRSPCAPLKELQGRCAVAFGLMGCPNGSACMRGHGFLPFWASIGSQYGRRSFSNPERKLKVSLACTAPVRHRGLLSAVLLATPPLRLRVRPRRSPAQRVLCQRQLDDELGCAR